MCMFTKAEMPLLMNRDIFISLSGFKQEEIDYNVRLKGHIVDYSFHDNYVNNITFQCYENLPDDSKEKDKFILTIIINPSYIVYIEICQES